jgi:hypothetical protein
MLGINWEEEEEKEDLIKDRFNKLKSDDGI